MMSERSYTALPAFLVPDPRITVDSLSTDSTYTVSGPRPGTPEPTPSTGTSMVPGVLGTRTDMTLGARGLMASAARYDLQLAAGGAPGPDGGARLLWKFQDDADTLWRDWDLPTSPEGGWEPIVYTDTDAMTEPDAVTLRNGTVIVAAVKGHQHICVVERDTGGSWTLSTVYSAAAVYTIRACPTVCELADGRVLLLFWVEGSSSTNLRSYIRATDGTWSLGERALLRTGIDFSSATPKRLRVVTNGSDVALIGWIHDPGLSPFEDVLYQWVSDTAGTGFTLIDQWDGSSSLLQGAYVDVICHQGRYGVAYLAETSAGSGDGVPYIRWLGSGFDALSSATPTLATLATTTDALRWGTLSGGAFSDGDLALVVDDCGALYIFGRDIIGGQEGHVRGSFDGGATWQAFGTGSASGEGVPWFDSNDGSTYARGFKAVWQGGRVLLVHQFAASPGTADDSLCAAYLGGWTTRPHPRTSDVSPWTDRAGYVETWLPFDKPDDCGWTLGGSGSPTITLDTAVGALKVVQTAGQSAQYTRTSAPSGSLAEGMHVTWGLLVAGGNVADAYLDLRISDGVSVAYEVRVTVSSTGITATDQVAGTPIGTVATSTTTQFLQIKVALENDAAAPANDGKVKIWYRTACREDGRWETVGATSTLQAMVAAAHHLKWGATAGAGTFYFRQLSWSSDQYTGLGVYGVDNPDDLCGRPVSTSGTYVDQGYQVFASSGPGRRGDAWTAEPLFDYGIERIFPTSCPSPTSPWRSEDDDSDVTIVLDLGTLPTAWAGNVLGVHLANINFRTYRLRGRKVGGAWETIFDGDASDGMSGLTYIRVGDAFEPDAGTVVTGHWTYHALAGFRVTWDTTYWATVLDNAEGAWTDAATMRTRIVTDGAAALSAGSGADLALVAPSVTVLAPDPSPYDQIELKIYTQDTAEGYFQIGCLVVGHVEYLTVPYSASRQVGLASLTEVTTAKTGGRRARALAAPRRTVTLGWEEGVPTRGVFAGNPDYIRAYSGGRAVGAIGDTAHNVAGLYERVCGAAVPLVYLPSVAYLQTGDAVQLLAPDAHLYSRITSADLALDTVRGDERRSEVVRVARVSLEEEK